MNYEKPSPTTTELTIDYILNFAIKASVFSHYVEYEIYKIIGISDSGAPIFQEKGKNYSPCPADSITDAQLFAHGSVKWDGCSNWLYDIQDQGYIHACDKDGLLKLGQVLGQCWEMTKEYIPETWNPC